MSHFISLRFLDKKAALLAMESIVNFHEFTVTDKLERIVSSLSHQHPDVRRRTRFELRKLVSDFAFPFAAEGPIDVMSENDCSQLLAQLKTHLAPPVIEEVAASPEVVPEPVKKPRAPRKAAAKKAPVTVAEEVSAPSTEVAPVKPKRASRAKKAKSPEASESGMTEDSKA